MQAEKLGVFSEICALSLYSSVYLRDYTGVPTFAKKTTYMVSERISVMNELATI